MPGLSWKPEEHTRQGLFVFLSVSDRFLSSCWCRLVVLWLSWCCQPVSLGVISQYRHRLYIYWLLATTAGCQRCHLSLSLSLSVARWLAMMGAKTLLSPLTTAALTGHWDNLGNQLTLWGLLCNVIGVLERNRQLYDILYVFYNPADINVVI